LFTDYFATKILKVLFQKSSQEVIGTETPVYGNQYNPSEITGYTGSLSLYAGLSTSTPAADGTNVTEPSAAEYHRVLIASYAYPSVNIFPTPDNGEVSNSIVLYYTEALSSWPSCTHFVLYDAETGGNLLAYGEFTSAVSPTSGKVVLIDIGDMTLSFSNVSDYFAEIILSIFSGDNYKLTLSGNSVYLGLCNTLPTKTDTGTTVASKEPSGANYSRVLLNNATEAPTDKLSTPLAGDIENDDTLFFPIVGTGGWGTLPYFVITDAATGGNVLLFGSLTSSITPAVDSVPLVRIGNLEISFN